jgi:hypothetical protein
MASAALPGPQHPVAPLSPAPRVTRWIGRFFLLLWATFWLWFNITSATTETEGSRAHIALACITAGLTLAAWFLPRIGGAIMIVGSAGAMWEFHNAPTIVVFAIPGAIIGIILLFSER